MKKNELPELVQAAIEATVRLKEGDSLIKKFAADLGITEGVLRNKIANSGEDKKSFLSLSETLAISKASNNSYIINAICEISHGTFIPNPPNLAINDDEIFMRFTESMKYLGELSTDINESLKDKKISPKEILRLRKDFIRLSGALSVLMEHLENKAIRDNQLLLNT
jgi:hypothetical protein